MGDLSTKIKDDLRAAFKRGESIKVGTLRLLQAAIQNAEIEKKKKESGLSDGEIIEVVGREVKKRNEAARLYREGGRVELAEKEELEAKMLVVYLPGQLSEEELRGIIEEALASGEKNTGKVMAMVMADVKGRADGSAVRKMVEETLQSKNEK